MRRLALLWPGIALTLTMVDDAIAGPILALGGALLGPSLGIPVAVSAFTVAVVALAWSALVASRHLDPGIQARIDDLVARVSGRRVVGQLVRRVGDEHPWATAVIAATISPVFAVLLARVLHPAQRLHRTVLVAGAAYGVLFSVTYAASGSVLSGLL